MHSAFVLRAESRIENSQHYGKHIPRGELIELLSKALLYSEAEAHWKGNAMTNNCKASFSILDKHVCSLDPSIPATVTFHPPVIEVTEPIANGTSEKRKASTPPAPEDIPKEKRARTEEMEVDSVASAERTFTPSHGNAVCERLLTCLSGYLSSRVCPGDYDINRARH